MSWKKSPEKDVVALCVLVQLLGGGSSFSASGPGKGMFSRLYLNVLNKYRWAHNAFAFQSISDDAAIFGTLTPDDSIVRCMQNLFLCRYLWLR